MLTDDSTDPDVFKARKARAKAKGYNGNGCGEDLAMAARQWMSPRVASGGYTNDKGNPENRRLTLEGQSEMWMTPNVPNVGRSIAHAEIKGRTATHNGKKVQIGLEHQAKTFWPTATTSDYKGSGPQIERSDGKIRDRLDWVTEQRLYLPPDPKTLSGQQSSRERRRLNPLFVEWLMGWPIGWTDCDRAVTGLSLWLRQGRGLLLELCSSPEEPVQGSLL